MSLDHHGMSLGEAMAALRAVCGEDAVVITAMGAAREWMALGPTRPLDLVFVPSSMGQATSLGLGLALARPERRVVVVNGDGSTLMNLGSLVTITAEAPDNLVVVVADNGVYEVTGGQPTPGAAPGRSAGDRIDLPALARACGFRVVERFSTLDRWRAALPGVLVAPGPVFVTLDVAPVPGARGPRSPGPAEQRGREFMAALGPTRPVASQPRAPIPPPDPARR